MQQANVIKDSIDVKVGIYCGSSNRLKSHHDWEKEMEKFEVCNLFAHCHFYLKSCDLDMGPHVLDCCSTLLCRFLS